MSLYEADDEEYLADPMDLVEEVVNSDDRFSAARADDGDVQFSVKSAWTEAAGYFSYRTELPALLFTLGFDLQTSRARMGEAMRLAAMINENLWLGHFDVWSDDGSIIFRHAAPMIGRAQISPGEVQALLAAALDASERFYPAFKFVVENGASPEEAVQAAMFEVAGEA